MLSGHEWKECRPAPPGRLFNLRCTLFGLGCCCAQCCWAGLPAFEFGGGNDGWLLPDLPKQATQETAAAAKKQGLQGVQQESLPPWLAAGCWLAETLSLMKAARGGRPHWLPDNETDHRSSKGAAPANFSCCSSSTLSQASH